MLRQTFTITSLLLASLVAFAQQTIRMEIASLPSYHNGNDEIYVAGSFNGWNPQNNAYKFTHTPDGNYTLELKMQPGMYEYKLTRGSWSKAECAAGGADIQNRFLKVEGDQIVNLQIAAWKDYYPPLSKISTASKQVKIIDTAFYIPQLQRTRRIWIYLPQDYTVSAKRYPVLYLHDGQNLFDNATSYSGEWGVDECLDSLKGKSCIVVGIDNGGLKRLNEYCPYDFDLKGIAANYSSNKGEGKLYTDFLVKTVKPYIDRQYRTLKNKGNTFVAGSSMGGLISLYAILRYPKVFGGAGVFSPAIWVGPAINDEIRKRGKGLRSKIYFMAGDQESESMVPDMVKAFNLLRKYSRTRMSMAIRAGAGHNENTWRKELPAFFNWLIE